MKGVGGLTRVAPVQVPVPALRPGHAHLPGALVRRAAQPPPPLSSSNREDGTPYRGRRLLAKPPPVPVFHPFLAPLPPGLVLGPDSLPLRPRRTERAWRGAALRSGWAAGPGRLRVKLPLMLAHRFPASFLFWGAHLGAGRRPSQRVCASGSAKPQCPPRPCHGHLRQACAAHSSRSGAGFPGEGGWPPTPTPRLVCASCRLGTGLPVSEGCRGPARAPGAPRGRARRALCSAQQLLAAAPGPSLPWSWGLGPLRQDCFPAAACPHREDRCFPGVGGLVSAA